MQNGDTINLDENKMIYCVTENFARRLCLNLYIIIAKCYVCLSIAILINKFKIKKQKSKIQNKYIKRPLIVAIYMQVPV